MKARLLAMKGRLLVALALIAGLGGYAIGQTVIVPYVATLHPFTDAIQVVPNGAPVVGNQYAPPALVTNVYGYYKGSSTYAVSGVVYTYPANVTFVQFAPSGTLSSAALYMPSNPSDGARSCFFTTQLINNLSIYGNTGQTLNGGLLASLSANTNLCFIYSLNNATWDRD